MANTLPPFFLTLIAGWGADVAAFRDAYAKLPVSTYAPQEWVDAVAATLVQVGSTVTDPVAVAAAIAHGLTAGYDPSAGSLA